MREPRQLVAFTPPRANPHEPLRYRPLFTIVGKLKIRRLYPHLRRLRSEDFRTTLATQHVKRQQHEPRLTEFNGTLDELILELVWRIRNDVVKWLLRLIL